MLCASLETGAFRPLESPPNHLYISLRFQQHGETLSNVDRILEGALDIHVHFGPDPKVERRAGAVEIALQAKELGMQGVVLKSHEYPTHPVAATTSELVPEVTVLGGVALDLEVGGLNIHAVEATANMGGRIVWMPTYSAKADREAKGLDGGISLLDNSGSLVHEVFPILEMIKSHDMVLATGHISTPSSRYRKIRSMSEEKLSSRPPSLPMASTTSGICWPSVFLA